MVRTIIFFLNKGDSGLTGLPGPKGEKGDGGKLDELLFKPLREIN